MVSTFRTKKILAPDIDLAPAKILIVDDYPANRMTAMALLSLEGYEVFEAESGAIALEKVIKIQPDLILLDVMMPEMDGFEVCQQLKQDEQTIIKLQGTPLIISPDSKITVMNEYIYNKTRFFLNKIFKNNPAQLRPILFELEKYMYNTKI